MYPVNPADGIYHLNIPWVEKTAINLADEKVFTVKVECANNEAKTIDTILLNGTKLDGLAINHKDIMSGGELVFVLK